jgi:glycosyltransferase involved in cell wall biosynthesis
MNYNFNLRVLYLGFALPKGVAEFHTDWCPAGQLFESNLLNELGNFTNLRRVSLTPRFDEFQKLKPDKSSLFLFEKEKMGLLDNFNRLCHYYTELINRNESPSHLLIYNLTPLFNRFIQWLKSQSFRPKLVLLLADSAQLGVPIHWFKRLRYRFKPSTWFDDEMLNLFDAAICLSPNAQNYFAKHRGQPSLWMPGGVTPTKDPPPFLRRRAQDEPLRIGYFGALAPHTGIANFAEMFLDIKSNVYLEVRGGGSQTALIKNLARRSNGRITFHPFEGTSKDAIAMARDRWDVLVNPRRAAFGNHNNFASKIFQYTLVGRPILTSLISGEEKVLGNNGFFMTSNYSKQEVENTLKTINSNSENLPEIARMAYTNVQMNYTWEKQTLSVIEFLGKLTALQN